MNVTKKTEIRCSIFWPCFPIFDFLESRENKVPFLAGARELVVDGNRAITEMLCAHRYDGIL